MAGWGLVWSVVAFALPLWALVRRARGHPLEPVWSAALLTVLAGVASVLVLGGASFAPASSATTCVITYALVLAYAAVCLRAADRLRPAQIQRGALLAVGGHLGRVPGPALPGAAHAAKRGGERSAFLEAAKRSHPRRRRDPLKEAAKRDAPLARRWKRNPPPKDTHRGGEEKPVEVAKTPHSRWKRAHPVEPIGEETPVE